jgi:hypothetical protein
VASPWDQILWRGSSHRIGILQCCTRINSICTYTCRCTYTQTWTYTRTHALIHSGRGYGPRSPRLWRSASAVVVRGIRLPVVPTQESDFLLLPSHLRGIGLPTVAPRRISLSSVFSPRIGFSAVALSWRIDVLPRDRLNILCEPAAAFKGTDYGKCLYDRKYTKGL